MGYYHHAIYGAWPGNAAARRVQARIELIQALGKAGRRQQAQAELLLAMLAVVARRPSVKKQVAPWRSRMGYPRKQPTCSAT